MWTPTELTTVTGSLRRSIEDAADTTVVGYDYTGGEIGIDHKY